ncbi:PAS domain S-box protein [Salinimicrobium sp. HB62]|uniref:PAS domain S-box protein n=1 Tax=Salinimicrobium sp. HB62 TaxID=3077781 RepID=UPI002D775533|nr:PAS domain S-box protein [Salinimicrobium sp. HB62]
MSSKKIGFPLKSDKPVLAGYLVFLIVLLLGAFIYWQRYRILHEERSREMRGIIQVIDNNISQVLKSSYSVALSQALLIGDNGEINDFEIKAKQLLEANPYLDAIQLVPNGVITHVYPMEENEAALNYNILQDETRNKEALRAIEENRMYFAGPFELKQGGLAVVGRLPVFIDEAFWGFSAVIIKFENFLKHAGFKELNSNDYKFQFSKVDPDTGNVTFFLDEDLSSDAYSEEILFTDGDWKIHIAPENEFVPFLSLLPLGVLFLFLAFWLKYRTIKVLKRPEKLQAMVDAQNIEIFNSNLRFKKIFNQAAVGMARMDTRTGTFIETNKRFRNFSGYSEKEIIGKNFRELSHPEDIEENQRLMQKLLQGEIKEYSLEKRAIKKNGTIGWIKLTVSPLWTPGQEPSDHIAIIEDITKSKEAELQLTKSYKVLVDQNERLVNFSYIISHDLRSHSTNIQSILDLYGMSELPEEKEHYVELLAKVTANLNQTLHHLNEVVSIQNSPNLKKETLDLQEFVNKTIENLSIQIREKKAEMIVEIPDGARVYFNSAYLESVLLNFISNSLRFSDENRKPVIEIRAIDRNGKWTLHISDNGIGIDLEKNMDKLFGLYKTFTNRRDSRGIGLLITKHQVEAMGGEIEVESTPGCGTTFKINFQ